MQRCPNGLLGRRCWNMTVRHLRQPIWVANCEIFLKSNKLTANWPYQYHLIMLRCCFTIVSVLCGLVFGCDLIACSLSLVKGEKEKKIIFAWNEFEFDWEKEIFSLVEKLPIIGKVPDTLLHTPTYFPFRLILSTKDLHCMVTDSNPRALDTWFHWS